jgi:hypothetical protein
MNLTQQRKLKKNERKAIQRGKPLVEKTLTRNLKVTTKEVNLYEQVVTVVTNLTSQKRNDPTIGT